MIGNAEQLCTNPSKEVAQATTLSTVVPNILCVLSMQPSSCHTSGDSVLKFLVDVRKIYEIIRRKNNIICDVAPHQLMLLTVVSPYLDLRFFDRFSLK